MALTDEEKEKLKREVEATMRATQQEQQQQNPGAPSEFDITGNAKIKHVIGVVSGKGGVGKSTVSAILATELRRAGYSVGLMDADITGPSIPRLFGIMNERLGAVDGNILPVITETGIKVVSTNLALDNENDPVVWRGPMLGSVLQQFYAQCDWGELDFLVCDMPPGTGDVPLTMFQSVPLDGLVIVSSPQNLVQMVVGKAVKMAKMMHIPVLGIVENMSYLSCPHCGDKIQVFGDSHLEETAKAYDIPVLGQLPIDPKLAAAADSGRVEDDVTRGLLPGVVGIARTLIED